MIHLFALNCASTCKNWEDPNCYKIIWEEFLTDARSGKIDKFRKHLHDELGADFDQYVEKVGDTKTKSIIANTYNADFDVIHENKDIDLIEISVQRTKMDSITFQTFVFKKIKNKWLLVD